MTVETIIMITAIFFLIKSFIYAVISFEKEEYIQGISLFFLIMTALLFLIK